MVTKLCASMVSNTKIVEIIIEMKYTTIKTTVTPTTKEPQRVAWANLGVQVGND